MKIYKKIFSIAMAACSILFLLGSKTSERYAYLMLHPQEVEKNFSECRPLKTSYCEDLKAAAANFMLLLTEWRKNPEDFGEKIMREQFAMVMLEEKFKLAKAKFRSQREASFVNALELQKRVEVAEEEYQEQKLKVDILLEVVAIMNPAN